VFGTCMRCSQGAWFGGSMAGTAAPEICPDARPAVAFGLPGTVLSRSAQTAAEVVCTAQLDGWGGLDLVRLPFAARVIVTRPKESERSKSGIQARGA
jgi:hypothetical protein